MPGGPGTQTFADVAIDFIERQPFATLDLCHAEPHFSDRLGLFVLVPPAIEQFINRQLRTAVGQLPAGELAKVVDLFECGAHGDLRCRCLHDTAGPRRSSKKSDEWLPTAFHVKRNSPVCGQFVG
jgi:hypothetical protein